MRNVSLLPVAGAGADATGTSREAVPAWAKLIPTKSVDAMRIAGRSTHELSVLDPGGGVEASAELMRCEDGCVGSFGWQPCASRRSVLVRGRAGLLELRGKIIVAFVVAVASSVTWIVISAQ